MQTKPVKQHGILRGLDATRASDSFEGKFGRMFRTLPKAHFPDEALEALATAMVSTDTGAQTPETDNPRDDEENTGISAGYTYLGQFIDHDLTFDPASSLQQHNDPDALVDYRTPRFDLDNLYGRGPDDQPYLYDETGRKFLLGRPLNGSPFDGHVQDLQRNNPPAGDKRAIIGDPRNDENVIVSQLQAIFLRFHNRLADEYPDHSFSFVQQQVRWHYQWMVLHDFLPTIIGKETLQQILPQLDKQNHAGTDHPQLRFYKWRNEPFMPVEFSVAAYRFGHSMVRPVYRLNTNKMSPDDGRVPIFRIDPATGRPDLANSLLGFREFPSDFAIDWRLFFDFGNKPNPFSPERIQPAYKIDTSLVNPLLNLPPTVAGNPHNLALRNLMRGKRMGLPSGQNVARKMGIPVIPDEKLLVGKATKDGNKIGSDGKKANPELVSIHPAFKGNAPLWYYILAEAQQAFVDNDTPIRLGPVGGRIVGEVFVGLMLGDGHSYLAQQPEWQPLEKLSRQGVFGITELISAAIA